MTQKCKNKIIYYFYSFTHFVSIKHVKLGLSANISPIKCLTGLKNEIFHFNVQLFYHRHYFPAFPLRSRFNIVRVHIRLAITHFVFVGKFASAQLGFSPHRLFFPTNRGHKRQCLAFIFHLLILLLLLWFFVLTSWKLFCLLFTCFCCHFAFPPLLWNTLWLSFQFSIVRQIFFTSLYLPTSSHYLHTYMFVCVVYFRFYCSCFFFLLWLLSMLTEITYIFMLQFWRFIYSSVITHFTYSHTHTHKQAHTNT